MNGRPLSEPYLPEGAASPVFPHVQVPGGRLWLMADQRAGPTGAVKGVVDR